MVTPIEAGSNHLTRREVLKTMRNFALGSILGSATGGLLFNEIGKGLNGVKTNLGTFFPLYEKHDIGINASSIPSNAQIFFREFAAPNLMTMEPNSILLGYMLVMQTHRFRPNSELFQTISLTGWLTEEQRLWSATLIYPHPI